MATVTVQDVTRLNDGVIPTYNAASAGGDKFSPGDHVFVHVKNTSAAAVTATFATPGKVAELDIADATASIPATSGDKMLGPFPASLFAGSDGLVSVSWSATSGVTFAVLRIP